MSTNDSIDVSQTLRHGNGATATIVESSKLLPWLMLTCLLSGIAIAFSVMTLIITMQRFGDLADRYSITEREARVAQERYNDVSRELARAGIAQSDH